MKASRQKIIIIALITAALVWSGASLWQQKYSNMGLTFFREDQDFRVYFSGLGWVKPGHLLYEQGYAEYPPLGLAYVTWPKFLTSQFETYHWLLWLSNGLLYLAAGWLTWKLTQVLKVKNKYAWSVWLLPGVLYYTFNRFDILPVFLILLSLYLGLKNQWKAAWLVWGAAIITKLYPLFLFPLWYSLAKLSDEKRGMSQIWYAVIPIVSFSLGAVLSGGWLAAVVPYLLQGQRVGEIGSLLGSLYFFSSAAWAKHKLINAAFYIVQFGLPVAWLALVLIKKKLRHHLGFNLLSASLVLFMLINLNPYYSNQWWLWLAPLLAMALPLNKLWWIVFYDVVNYLQYPLVVEWFGRYSLITEYAVLFRGGIFVIVTCIIVLEISNIIKSEYESLGSSPNI